MACWIDCAVCSPTRSISVRRSTSASCSAPYVWNDSMMFCFVCLPTPSTPSSALAIRRSRVHHVNPLSVTSCFARREVGWTTISVDSCAVTGRGTDRTHGRRPAHLPFAKWVSVVTVVAFCEHCHGCCSNSWLSMVSIQYSPPQRTHAHSSALPYRSTIIRFRCRLLHWQPLVCQ